MFVIDKTCRGRVRVGANIRAGVGGGSGSRCGAIIGFPSHIKGGRSGQVCGGGCGRLCGIGSDVDSRVTTHTMGDRDVTGTGLSLVLHAHGERLGGSLVVLFVFIDVREVISSYYLCVPLVSRSHIREGIRC